MAQKRVENIEEIEAYIKVRTNLVQSVRQIFTEMGEVYGYDKVSYETYEFVMEKEISDWHIVLQRISKIWPTCNYNS